MASAITLEGIDQAISNLKYKNKNTLKYRFVQHIRQYYTIENAVVSLNEIDHEELIKMLWDTDHSLGAIKNKRKNLNSVRSAVNADLKKLYEKGENPEGIKIGSSNIFIMSEDAKDKILKKLGYDLQPDGTLKLDQIMDILKLANETVSGSMAVEDTEIKDGLKKIDRLKDLIKGLSEKVGLGSAGSSKKIPEADSIAGKGDEDGSGSMGMTEALDEEPLDQVEEIADLENEIEVVDDVDDVEIDEIVDTEQDEIDEELEDVSDEEDAELDDVEDVDEVEEIIGDDVSEDVSDDPGSGDEDTGEGVGLGQDSGQEETGIDIGGDELLSRGIGTGLKAVGKEDEGGFGGNLESKGDGQESALAEMDDVLGEISLDEIDDIEDVEELDAEEVVDDVDDVEIDEIVDTEQDEIDEELEDVSDEPGSGDEDTGEGVGLGQDSGQEETGIDIGGDELLSRGIGTGLKTVGKEDEGGFDGKLESKGDGQESALAEMDDVLGEISLDEIDDIEDVEELDAEEVVDDVDDVEIDEIVDTEQDEIDEELEDVSDEPGSGDEDTGEGVGLGQDSGQEETGIDIGGDELLSRGIGTGLEAVGKEDGKAVGYGKAENAEHRFELGEEQRESEQLGLPVDSLGQEYKIDKDGKIKNNKLLSEEFDGYLGSMDRYYNQYLLIPGGEYIIGSKHPKKDEKSEQKVYLEPFYIGRFPITNGLFEIFVEKTGYKTTAEKVGYGTVYYGRFEKKRDETTGLITSTWNASLYCKIVKSACWYQPSGPKSTLYNKRNHPVVQISMEDATAFAAWTGKRLPTENEWEAASRTANGWILPWGQEWKKDACNIEDSYTADTTPVDKYVEFENNFGIVDTIGNVLEWTNSSFDSTSPKKHGAKYKAVKGGSWISGNDIRLFSRFMIKSELHSNILGFRCVAY